MIGADRFVGNLSPAVQTTHATQRYQRGYSDIDMWNFDVLLADVIVAGCEWTIQHGHGSPWKLAQDDWHDIVRQIRDGFATRNSSGAPQPSKEVWRLLRKNFQYLWD